MHPPLPQRLIGSRVKAARQAHDWTQDRLADALGLKDRQSISDIENGKRSLRPDELVLLTEVLDHDIEFFLDPFAVSGEAQFSWRAPPELAPRCLDDFEVRAGRWIGLLRWLRETERGQTNPLKQSLRLTMRSSFEDSIARAERLVETLDLGRVPADNLVQRVEQNLDCPILFVDAVKTSHGDSISGATCHLQDLSVILINRHESEARRFYDLAHELFHVLTWDAMRPDHRESNSSEARGKVKRIEQLANNFAAALLMPTKSLEQAVDQRRTHDLEHLADVAAGLRVAPSALGWRLYNMKWITDPTLEKLKQQRQPEPHAGTPKRFSSTFVEMLHRAIDRGQLSARKAAKTMGMNLSGLADLFTEHSLDPAFDL